MNNNIQHTNNTQHTTKNKGSEVKAKKDPVKSHRDLIVYQKAKKNTVDLIRYFSDKKPSWTERYLIDQLIRAAASIGANLAEGYGRLYKRDYRRFISISRGSSFEVEYWASLLEEVNLKDKNYLLKIIEINNEIIKMLTVMMKKLGK